MGNSDYKVEAFTGIRPTGGLTIANAIGGVNPIVKLQESGKIKSSMVFVADLHALTDTEAKDSQKAVIDVVKDYISLGLDPKKNKIFIQSMLVEEVAELTIYLCRLVSVAELLRVPTLKEKIKHGQSETSANVLLAMYPIMMAADILLQRTEYVPVGEDQLAHMEMTRFLAQKFNKRYGDVFPIPKTLSLGEPIRVKSLNGSGKMSKTDPNGAILLDDPIEISLSKIKKAQTAFAGERSETLETLVLIGEFLSKEEERSNISAIMQRHYAGENVMGELKSFIGALLKKYLEEFQSKKKSLDEEEILKKIEEDSKIAKKNAQDTLKEVRKTMGMEYITDSF
ncbi:MAG: tryptophan--tRNA ligase [Candidatus Dojkabacteria bacterium]